MQCNHILMVHCKIKITRKTTWRTWKTKRFSVQKRAKSLNKICHARFCCVHIVWIWQTNNEFATKLMPTVSRIVPFKISKSAPKWTQFDGTNKPIRINLSFTQFPVFPKTFIYLSLQHAVAHLRMICVVLSGHGFQSSFEMASVDMRLYTANDKIWNDTKNLSRFYNQTKSNNAPNTFVFSAKNK